MTAAPSPSLIAVVEDDAGLRTAIAGLLASAGFQSVSFSSAEDFLASPHAKAASCLILDFSLSGMSGLDLLRHMAAHGPALNTICITAHEDKDGRLRAEALSAGALKVLYKPFNNSELLGDVRSICNHGQLPP
jgi:FixJ family two-component response regulator